MSQEKNRASKDIALHWRNFIIVIIVILLLGIIIGLIITPHPDFQNKTGPDEVVKHAAHPGLSVRP